MNKATLALARGIIGVCEHDKFSASDDELRLAKALLELEAELEWTRKRHLFLGEPRHGEQT
ncbi:MAG: hypothetical protein JWN13_5599 [Betaproteobacteria bacterium]|jgi:hypothetical protein|nr:hypothetical protein [Betaproteobacteria bacterium]